MTKFNTAPTADVIARSLAAAGFQIQRSGSGLSPSQYIYASIFDEDGNEVFAPVKIRISDHEAKPTYEMMNGAADYEVGPHGMAVDDWTRVVIRLCEAAGLPVPASVRGLRTRRQNAEDKAVAASAAAKLAMEPFLAAREASRVWVDAEMERMGMSHLTGVKRKKLRAKLTKKFQGA